jgi:hypothetical protein
MKLSMINISAPITVVLMPFQKERVWPVGGGIWNRYELLAVKWIVFAAI